MIKEKKIYKKDFTSEEWKMLCNALGVFPDVYREIEFVVIEARVNPRTEM